jgi:hypothetical protein
MCNNIRHQNSSQHLKEQPHHIEETRDIGSNSGTQSQQPRSQRSHRKKQPNQHKRKHKPRQIKKLPRPHKLHRNPLRRPESAPTRRIQRVRRMHTIAESDRAAHIAFAVVPECPSGSWGCAGDAGGVGLQEVDDIGGAGVDGTGEEGQED